MIASHRPPYAPLGRPKSTQDAELHPDPQELDRQATAGEECQDPDDLSGAGDQNLVLVGHRAVCRQCGDQIALPLPMQVDRFLDWTRATASKHAGCRRA